MLMPGDVVRLELGAPTGSEAGLQRPAVVITAGQILRGGPNVVQVVPLTTTLRNSGAEVTLDPDPGNGLREPSAAQCQHIRSVATTRIASHLGNVGPAALQQIKSTVAILIDA